jgi:hypothetical protein
MLGIVETAPVNASADRSDRRTFRIDELRVDLAGV